MMRSGFTYPDLPHRRRHGPQGYATYDSYRPWLRDEFDFRCVFCLIREQWGRVSGEFDLDHYIPVSLHPDGATDYDNLLYACSVCNAAKGSHLIPDPNAVLTAREIVVHDDGTVEGINEDADRIIRVLDLNDVEYWRWRTWTSPESAAAATGRNTWNTRSRIALIFDLMPPIRPFFPPRHQPRESTLRDLCAKIQP